MFHPRHKYFSQSLSFSQCATCGTFLYEITMKRDKKRMKKHESDNFNEYNIFTIKFKIYFK